MFHLNLTKITALHMTTKTHFFITPRSVLLRMRNVSAKSCRETQSSRFVFSTYFFENRTVYEIMWKKYCRARRGTGDNMTHAHCTLDT